MASIDDAPATVVEGAGARERELRSDPDALPRGTTIGRYVVIDRIGAGGMGAVYSAYDAALHRRVALKLLRSPGIEQERLLAEARTMAQLAHPAIVAVHDVGEFESQVFLAMELVEGATLRRWQAKQRSWRETVGLYATIADALAYAHDRGVIHRDFKPDNVIVDASDRPRVTDFGLAKVDPDADPSPASSLITKHTISGTGAGTPGYMSPEQRMGEPTDASTDQYAFCVSLFEALYGWLPVDGTAPPSMMLHDAGQDLVALGQLDDAVAVLRHAITIAGDPADLPRVVAGLHMALGETLRQLGDLANAEREHRAALELADRALPTGVLTEQILFNLASVENKRGDDKDAEVAIERALQIVRAVPPGASDADDYMGETSLLHKKSQIQLGLGNSAAAVTTAKEALEAGQREQIDSDMYGTVHNDLARALWANGQRDLARQAMHQAALDYQLAGDVAKQQAAEAWLRDPK